MQTNGGVDCKNIYVKKRYTCNIFVELTYNSFVICFLHVYGFCFSLGSEKRQLELLHITKENQRILQRLSTCRPRYSAQVWQEQWLRHLELMDAIGRYPRFFSAQVSIL